MEAANLTAEQLRELLSYDSETGLFRWQVKRKGTRPSGRAGKVQSAGYIQIRINGRDLYAHRLAWLHVHGKWPDFCIDHVNGVRDDNRLANLRQATKAENKQNQRKPNANGRSGFLGVSWLKANQRWQAQITVAGKNRHLGLFDSPEAAHAAYMAAKAELHPFSVISHTV